MSSNLACIGMGVTSPAELSELVAQVARLGSEPVADSPADFAAFCARESERWGRLVREARLTLD